MPDRVTRAVKEAQAILARYVEPGPRDCQNTINDLLAVLDDERLVQAMEEEDERQSHQTGPARRSKINMHEDFEVKYWTKELGVSRDELQKPVDKVRNSAVTEARGMLAIFGARPVRCFMPWQSQLPICLGLCGWQVRVVGHP